MGEIKIDSKVAGDFLFKLNVRRVDARIGVIAAEHAHAAKAWEGISKRAGRREIVNRRARACCRRNQTRPRGADERVGKETTRDGLLLHTISGNRSHLA